MESMQTISHWYALARRMDKAVFPLAVGPVSTQQVLLFMGTSLHPTEAPVNVGMCQRNDQRRAARTGRRNLFLHHADDQLADIRLIQLLAAADGFLAGQCLKKCESSPTEINNFRFLLQSKPVDDYIPDIPPEPLSLQPHVRNCGTPTLLLHSS